MSEYAMPCPMPANLPVTSVPGILLRDFWDQKKIHVLLLIFPGIWPPFSVSSLLVTRPPDVTTHRILARAGFENSGWQTPFQKNSNNPVDYRPVLVCEKAFGTYKKIICLLPLLGAQQPPEDSRCLAVPKELA